MRIARRIVAGTALFLLVAPTIVGLYRFYSYQSPSGEHAAGIGIVHGSLLENVYRLVLVLIAAAALFWPGRASINAPKQ